MKTKDDFEEIVKAESWRRAGKISGNKMRAAMETIQKITWFEAGARFADQLIELHIESGGEYPFSPSTTAGGKDE